MKIRITQVVPFALFILLAGCSSKPERADPPEGYFATYIDEDGLKKFQYSIELPESKSKGGKRPRGNRSAGTGGGGRKGPPSGRGGSDPSQRISEQLHNMLERELAQSGYCHSGYRETESSLIPPLVFIRGQCSEMATLEDRANFPEE